MGIFSRLSRLKKADKHSPHIQGNTITRNQDTKAVPDVQGYPGIELEDYYLYYLQDSLKDTVALRARVLYINKRELMFEISNDSAAAEAQKEIQNNSETESSSVVDPVFEEGKNITLKLQIPFRSEFVRATGRITGIEYDVVNYTIRVKAAYTKILGSDNEILFDTILDMLL
ncbi:MAG: hypothetical protein DWB56_06255 [Candidatus Jettenia sp.]|uniref:Uncharacterized protein n=1 Tax=Candidatus Jettenia caeni TaxID=247490 RepID=I3IR54_9BACT|nr:hypothetical protein [Candidatus Jettenia sp. AMX1]MBC6928556.1 hypothetical protein [Candidatus Jettenia sp.]NUN24747.1 hypothetical protein [Candidatus Jettenia caeni]KAA0249178.1 MAG: hypothetical protein EDM77_09775 [Candidatus Jettenia sp. AMX1]MCE7879775.1 hypothetical protein [Candidatus Jettenia sp. AMX1]MCQ3926456.1 hypothetical protein [Candidatus Jettenia sp.]